MSEAGMIDLVAAIVLTALATTSTAALILASPLDRRPAARLIVVVALWFTAVTVLAAAGVSANIPALGVAIVAPVVIGVIAALRVSSIRALALGVPLALLVGVHLGRLLGGFFLALHADGRLPATFALSAGWGDIVIAALAAPIAWMAARRAPYWRAATLLWNALGFVDLVAAVTLGVGSIPDSPIRFIYEDAVAGTMTTLPWFLIPGFLVPIYLLSHLAVFARIAASARTSAISDLAVNLGRP